MILYNVTVKVDLEIHDEWFRWMKEKHIPDVINTGLFVDSKMCQLLGQDESEGITYAIQYFCESMEDYEKYVKEFSPQLQKEHNERYKDRFVAFRTLMEVV